jgi:hypothetical protein
LRRSAARCRGNINGPNASRRFGRLRAGWYAAKCCPRGSRAAPSDAERFLLCLTPFLGGVWAGVNRTVLIVSVGDSVSLNGVVPCPLCCSQYSSRTSVWVVSLMSSLQVASANCFQRRISVTVPCHALQVLSVFPTPSKSAIAQGHHHPDCDHLRIS